jgi:pantoate--beta-alanine ligase
MRDKGPKASALVPTMGALHEGHLSLIRKAAQTGKPVVVSIFVNPTQFGPNEDYSRYPRSFDQDCELSEKAGAHAIFHPSAEEMYAQQQTSRIIVPQVTQHFEGALRPGHFDGVATVVCKLFQIVRPDAAFFGLKDLQQCAVISRMVQDLNVPVDLSFEPTVRESDGLAKSSRNVYLSESDRKTAPLLYHHLTQSRKAIAAGKSPNIVLKAAQNSLTEAGFLVDYYELIDRRTFAPSHEITTNSAIIVAAKLGNTRLIDNVLLFEG